MISKFSSKRHPLVKIVKNVAFNDNWCAIWLVLTLGLLIVIEEEGAGIGILNAFYLLDNDAADDYLRVMNDLLKVVANWMKIQSKI